MLISCKKRLLDEKIWKLIICKFVPENYLQITQNIKFKLDSLTNEVLNLNSSIMNFILN